MFDHLKINVRLMLIVVAAIIGMLGVASVGLLDLRSNLFTERLDKLKNIVGIAQSIMVYYNNKAESGEISQESARKQALAEIQAIRYGEDDYFFVYDQKGTVLAHSNRDIINTNRIDSKDKNGVYAVREVLAQARSGNGMTYLYYPRAGQDTPVPKMNYSVLFKPWDMTVGSGIYIDDIRERFWGNVARVSIIILILMAIVGGIALLIADGIRKPLKLVTDRMGELARGNMEIELPITNRGDEIGDIARAVVVFKEYMLEHQRLAEREQRHRESRQRRAERIETLIKAFDTAIASVAERVSASAERLHADAQGLSANADQTSRQATAVARAAEEASVNVQTVASATEELSMSVNEIGRQVRESSQIATTAVEAANRTNVTVAGLSDAADKIGEVVKLINDIASQTNLLALNATIEAARAGNAGKGFAVVASEVKTLASQTAKATGDIQAQVGQMQAATNTAVEAIRDISETIRRMSEITAVIAATVTEQGAATEEIARNVVQATSGTSLVSTTIAGVSGAADETGGMATQALSAAGDLSQQAKKLHVVVADFIQQVRVA